MDTLQKALNEVLLHAPYQAFAEIIAEKLAARGVTLTTRERRQLTEQLKSNATDTFRFRRWRWWENRHVTVEVAAEEAEALHERFTEFLERQLPGLIDSTVEDLSADILQTLNRRWLAESRRQNRELRGFQRRLHRRWGRAIDRLRMSLVIAREFGESVNTAFRSDADLAHPSLLEVLTRLHARACQVTEEIACLLDAGLADGAMARWRTLHEIAVVALFLKEYGEDLAKRYIDHQVVESFRAAPDYQQCYERCETGRGRVRAVRRDVVEFVELFQLLRRGPIAVEMTLSNHPPSPCPLFPLPPQFSSPSLLQEGPGMPQAMRTLRVTACPSCGSTTIRAVKGYWSGSYRGKRYVVKDLRHFQCAWCGEKVYDPDAMRRIQAVSPAFAKRQRAQKSA